jgi:preprotein translocase subunit SecD
LALIIYTLIVLALFKLIPVTLTLAGIAGFILSIGMAVDANVLIFERMKEELRNKKPIVSAIDEGFRHAWNSIRDSNVSSLITCFILAWFGTSIIKGFAITLALGILVSMFSAITITKTFLRLVGTKWLEKRLWLIARIK